MSSAADHPRPERRVTTGEDFVAALRAAAPYVHAHHGRTFVVVIPGEICARDDVDRLLGDLALLHSLGVGLVLVHGSRPQIDEELRLRGLAARYHGDRRVTDVASMRAVKAAVGVLRMDLEARLSASRSVTVKEESQPRVVGGSWVTAKPVGVRDGVDHQLTGEVRRIDIASIRQAVAQGQIVLLSPVGYSPTGEAFNLRNADIAESVSIGLGADKLIFVMDSEPGRWRSLLGTGDSGQISLSAAEPLVGAVGPELGVEDRNCIRAGIAAVTGGVRRVHLIGTEGASPLLRELYTRDGAGLMIADEDDYEAIRPATVEDARAIAELIAPLERQGILRPRSAEQLELDIDTFSVIVRDGMVIACNALVDFPDDEAAEFACVVVHPAYRRRDLAAALLRRARATARARGYRRLFALTTATPHWFLEHGFVPGTVGDLPAAKTRTYDASRASKVLLLEAP
ncbi:MAG: amino-acid N-acetyltransferase [Tetrasphaera jenkinsii]|uniref:amino-acid N-acetyltransferase n=1 Tax=Nostocoides jenkinsii Ben 74 TaxID=1193518 RepID=A0A077M4W8_9MICO|nr:amino-acid N-acetyltransferase [Tetrasphaera jenkinsii]MCI1262893.1 amino-acid N-acetyltransferase [Tetrasphaera jenkinsii]CCI51604.1 Amino-acid acetyltransferase [Tetrasphaera jenkinsii Ben 74]